MINIFKSIKPNSRYTLNGKTIVVDSIKDKKIIWYYLDEWWKFQTRFSHLKYMNKFLFKLKASKYKYL